MADGNGKSNAGALKTLGMVIFALIALVEALVLGNASKQADELKAQAVQIARLEEAVVALRPLPQQVASIDATVKATLDLLKSHMTEK